jgi:hypothetical protein
MKSSGLLTKNIIEMQEGDKVKIVDDYKEYHPQTGKLDISWRAGAEGIYLGTENKRGTIVGIVKSGSEQAGYFYFRVRPQYIEKI